MVFSDGTTADALTVLVGEGAYEGLSAFVEVQPFDQSCAVDFRGIIFDGTPPGTP